MDSPGARNWGRSYLKLDRFAVLHLAREHGLGGNERNLLLTLMILADMRSAECRGAKSDLANEAGMSVRKVTSSLERLVACRFVEILDDFGPNRAGRLVVLVYDLLVTDARPEVRDPLEARRSVLSCTDHPLSLTAYLPRDGAFPQVTGSDSRTPARVGRGSGAGRTWVGRGSDAVEPSTDEPGCPRCGELVFENECFSGHKSVLLTSEDGRLTRIELEAGERGTPAAVRQAIYEDGEDEEREESVGFAPRGRIDLRDETGKLVARLGPVDEAA